MWRRSSLDRWTFLRPHILHDLHTAHNPSYSSSPPPRSSRHCARTPSSSSSSVREERQDTPSNVLAIMSGSPTPGGGIIFTVLFMPIPHFLLHNWSSRQTCCERHHITYASILPAPTIAPYSQKNYCKIAVPSGCRPANALYLRPRKLNSILICHKSVLVPGDIKVIVIIEHHQREG